MTFRLVLTICRSHLPERQTHLMIRLPFFLIPVLIGGALLTLTPASLAASDPLPPTPASAAGASDTIATDSVAPGILEELVVTALGVGRERASLGYSVAELTASDLDTYGSTSLEAALQGKVSGLDIRPSSGSPGASAQIVIRGARSFTGDNMPLFVIDGMPVESAPDFSTGNSTRGANHADRLIDINPSEIENISVLKGQAAAALYGLRASNGVILITTKGASAGGDGRTRVEFSTDISAEIASRSFHRQEIYAQGNSIDAYDPNSAMTWGPRISSLPDDPEYGGNNQGHPGEYYNPKLASAGLSGWISPAIHDNTSDFLRNGLTENARLQISRSGRTLSAALALNNSYQSGIVPNTGMRRWGARGKVFWRPATGWNTGFSANYASTTIKTAPGANSAIMNVVYSAPAEYDLRGIPSHTPGNPQEQVCYRPTVYDNPYWWADNNEYSQHTDRFFGNMHVEYSVPFPTSSGMSLKIREQAGIDSYTSSYCDLLEAGSAGASSGSITNYGLARTVFNNLLTATYTLLAGDFGLDLLAGCEVNQDNRREWSYTGSGFNFYGLPTISNATSYSSVEYNTHARTVGFFGNLGVSWRGALYLNATLRNDHVSTMPRGRRSLTYPSVSASWIVSEIPALRAAAWLDMAKLRLSYAQVGQAGEYVASYFCVPAYTGGMYTYTPLRYPLGHLSAYRPYPQIYDPDLKPQNTRNLEAGLDLSLFSRRLDLSFSFSWQDVKNQIFSVPMPGSTGYKYMFTNGGKMRTLSEELDLRGVILRGADYELWAGGNISLIHNKVARLAPGVESIMLGGFTSPQVRAMGGHTYPNIYGTAFKRTSSGELLLSGGLPQSTGAAVDLGECSPDFVSGFSLGGRWRALSLSATLSWQQGGRMYHGTNQVLNSSGVTKASLPYHEGRLVADGIDQTTGLPNTVEVDASAYYMAYYNVAEAAVYDMSFVKLRDMTLAYDFDLGHFHFRVSAFARNVLLWTALPDFDPESSQGNGNMGGYFERFSLPATTSVGGGLAISF